MHAGASYLRMQGGPEGIRRRHGQVMIEYLVVAVILLVSWAILALFLYVFKEYGGRILNLMASEYP